MDPVRALEAAARRYGSGAAREKRRWLAEVGEARRLSVRSLVRLQDVVAFLRAHPDDAALVASLDAATALVRARAMALTDEERERADGTGLPGTSVRQPFTYALARHLLRIAPERVELDWSELDDQGELYDLLGTLVLPAEAPALDDVEAGLRAWLERARGGTGESALAVVVRLLEGLSIAPALRAALFESCAVPLRLRLDAPGDGRAETALAEGSIARQRGPLRRESWSLAPRIRRPLDDARRVPERAARAFLDRALLCLAGRGLEIFPLTHADPRDVTRVQCGRGVDVWLAGVQPEERCAFEALFFFLVVKNRVPIAYGPASPFLGCCEMGINLFEEFRGGETRFLYAQVMRVLYHVLGVRRFHVSAYGMGKHNEEALASGAFWFYRKLGFLPESPEVEALARAEEERLRARPGARSDRRTLLRFATAGAALDLSGGACPPFDSCGLARAATDWIQREHGGDRTRAADRGADQVRRALGLGALRGWSPAERASLQRMAPVLCCVPDLAAWTARERAGVARLVRGKAARSEAGTARAFPSHARLARALRGLAGSGD